MVQFEMYNAYSEYSSAYALNAYKSYWANGGTDRTYSSITILVVGTSYSAAKIICGNYNGLRYRTGLKATTSGVTFGNGYNGDSSDTGSGIPLYIWGIREMEFPFEQK